MTSSKKPFLSQKERVGLLALLVVVLGILLFRMAQVKVWARGDDDTSGRVEVENAAQPVVETMNDDSVFVEFATPKSKAGRKKGNKKGSKKPKQPKAAPEVRPRNPLDEIL